MNPIEFGKFIASLRNEKKLTQEELAEKLYIDKRKVSRWECGMSIPDFETLIQLSEILDVSLYELSICQRIEKEKLTRKAINKFKSIKDFKKYKLKKKIGMIILTLLIIFFIFTTIYTFRYYGTVEIYSFNSLDENYSIEGTYTHANDYAIYNISQIRLNNGGENLINQLNNCTFEIYDGTLRITHIKSINSVNGSNENIYYLKEFEDNKTIPKELTNNKLSLIISCQNTKLAKQDEYRIKFEFIKKYDNKFF